MTSPGAVARPWRVVAGGLAHETHTFAATPTPVAAFQAYEWAEGDGLVVTYRGTRTSLGGMIDGAAETGLTLVHGFYAFALPSGLVPARDFAELPARFLASFRAAGNVDGVLVVLHGAMVAEGTDDVEREGLDRVRALVGPEMPVVATLDFHANISRRMAAAADLLVGYDTYPHVDVYERGAEAARLARRLLDTPGICTVNLASLPYRTLTRPIYPPDAAIAFPGVVLV